MSLEPPFLAPTGTLAELFQLAQEVEASIGAVLDHSEIAYRDINAGSSGVFFVGWNPHRWTDLDGAGQAALGSARKVVDAWRGLSQAAITASATERSKEFEKSTRVFDRVLVRSDGGQDGAPASTVAGVRDKISAALTKQLKMISDLPTAHGPGGSFLAPDTNAVLARPDLEQWNVGGRQTLVFVPQVIRELDAMKMHDRVGERATAVIGRLKEYGRRGDTFEGVKLAGDLWVREVPIEADMTATLPWLRGGHGDDELLASVLELKWLDLRADVLLVTGDRNLQNKARLARVRCLDVDELPAAGGP